MQAFKEKINPKVVVGFWKSVLIRAQEYIESDDNVVFLDEKMGDDNDFDVDDEL